ncbi:MAG: sulfite exporter TauE/SafE family protein [Caldilinea sp.]|nr:sulfite exporter TauE/SafE family protein [Caldilinea sp.]MCW5839645.1 sulfite exporter TauE/SafE family protein [Caldilinea sp.]HRW49383.1 sulfite exporter TauE/SafE family protein [Caldilinea sp.]
MMLDFFSVLSPWQWALAALGAYLVGISKTGIAGLGVFSVALFASALPARESTGIVLIILIAADIVAVITYRRQASWPHLLRLFPWAAVGIFIGFLVMGRIDAQTTQRLIGAILVTIVVVHFWRRARTKALADLEAEAKPHPLLAAVTGVSAGFTTMVANAAGPIMVIYLLAMRLPKYIFMGTAAWYFFILNLFKVPFSYSLGLINANSLPISLALAPVAVAGALTGRVLIRHINQQVFELLALVLTFVAGLRLLFW